MQLQQAWPIVGLLLLFIGSVFAHEKANEVELSASSKAAKLEACAAPTEDMRRNHMDYLFHKRDQTMYKGIRTADFSLRECIDCHVSRPVADEFVPINAKGEFCESCHEEVGQKIDCFSCHRSTPDEH